MPAGSLVDPTNSPARLAALLAYDILDAPREREFDELVELVAAICGTPIAVVNLITDRRQWFMAETGLSIRETPLDAPICRQIMLQPGITIITNPRADPRISLNPLVNADPGMQFYAGCLLQTPEGHGIGTLCVMDHQPRALTASQQSALQIIARQVMAQLELRRSMKQKNELLQQKEMLLREINHRTKNHLQLIIGLIQLQSRQLSDPQARAALADTSRRINSIATVHEKLYKADQVDAVNARTYLSELIAGIEASASGDTSFVVDMDNVVLPLDKAVPLALILNELVTNSLKYAYTPDVPGVITIKLKSIGTRTCLTVADDGMGLPHGFGFKKSGSVGMKIIHSLAKQLRAEISFMARKPGLECRLTFACSWSDGEQNLES